MNSKERCITELIKKSILEGWDAGKEKSFPEITKKVNSTMKKAGFLDEVSPRRIGAYLRKFLSIETERRGHTNVTYPVLTPQIVERLSAKL